MLLFDPKGVRYVLLCNMPRYDFCNPDYMHVNLHLDRGDPGLLYLIYLNYNIKLRN